MFDVSGYDVRESLTEGGVFGVYRALRKTDGAEVALKVVQALDPDGRLAGQLRRELELSREMDPDAVARGITIEVQADRPVLVREFRGASTLGARVAAGPMPVEDFCRVALAVVRALAAVHRGGVVHRDVKPSNILLDAEGERAWLTDFGIATRVDGADAQGEHLEGTLQYMAPEQSGRTRRAVGPASDLYALGVVFYEMLTGALPFHRSTALEWVHAHLAMEPPAPRGLRPDLPPALEAITLKLLSKDPDARYQSCAGLAADLERCRAALARGAAPHAFTLGTEDLPERFHRPQGLVGRTRVLASLCDAYDRVADGDGAVVRVRGEAGAGKSALVSELRRHVVAHGGRFAQGKHDLHQRGVPYAALLTALRQAVRSLLGSDAPSLARWSARLSEALRPNAGVLAAVIPELASVLGALDPVPPIGPAEADVRFQLAFHALVGALAAPGEPLCLFIDDAQWADEASLRLLRAIATRCPARVLLLTAERDPEPDPGGLREAFWKGLDEDGAPVTAVEVGPIDEDSVTTLVERVFPAPAHDARALAAAVRARTRGNPFATVEFLGALADAGVVRFDPVDCRWRWDLDEVRAARVPDTAAELVAARLSSLPSASRRTLGLAAVVGARFSADLVAAVGELGDDEVAAHLAEAMNDGLAAPMPGDDPSRAPWRFAHDRVEEAAYAALPEADRVAAHARVYHALRLRWGNDLDGERLFTLSHHLSLGRSEITLDDDRQEAASIARRAATVAREAAAYRAALDDLALVDELRGSDGWAGRHDERVELLVDRAECAYLATDFAEVERAAEAARALARNAVERARVEEVRVRAFNHRGEHARAVETALAALETLGQRFPESPGNGSVIGALAATRLKLGRRGADALEELPELDDPTLALVLKLLVSCSASTFFVAPNLFPLIAFRVVQITAANGATGLSAFGYAAYALLLTAHFGQVDTGLRFGELARRTVDRFGAEALRPQVEFLFNYFIRHWKDPLADCAADHAVAARRGLEVGSLEYWAYNLTAADAAEFLRGAALETLLTRVRRSHEQLKALRQTKTTAFHSVFVGMIEVLMGLGDERALTAREEEVLAPHAPPRATSTAPPTSSSSARSAARSSVTPWAPSRPRAASRSTWP
ncbi:MAG: AAA family ATPase [Polyangiales bacterium]